MQGIIGAFFGFVSSFLLSLLLLKQPDVFDKIPEIVEQPVYLVFIIVATFLGLVLGYACRRNAHPARSNLVTRSSFISNMKFDNPLADMVVVSLGIFILAFVKGDGWLVFFILLLWFVYRSVLLLIKMDNTTQ